MNINRHNYEEYFVLYLDNELSAAERSQVEKFVSANPDLKEELLMLQQSKLIPDPGIHFDKTLLFRQAGDEEINHSNYEEYLLLYVDNELNADQRKMVESFLDQNPAIRSELDLFEQTISNADSNIIFPDKELLYRKEEPVAGIVVMRWWKVAAAAAVLITAGLIGYNTLADHHSGETGMANNGDPVNSTIDQKKATQDPDNSGSVVLTPPQEKTEKAGLPDPGKGADPKDKIKVQSTTRIEPEALATTVKNPMQTKTDGGNTPNESPDVIAKLDNDTPVKTLDLSPEKNSISSETFTNNAVTDGIAEPSNPQIVALDDEPNRKSRGLFRKATRVFERRTNIDATDDDERLLIGGFTVKLK
jgi:hypothetical protein